MPASFPYTGLRLFTFPLLLLQSLHNTKKYYFAFITLLLQLPSLSYYFATKHFAADTKFPGVVELKTQLLILENILWLPLCRINKFGLNTLPSKNVAIPYTCGLTQYALNKTLPARPNIGFTIFLITTKNLHRDWLAPEDS